MQEEEPLSSRLTTIRALTTPQVESPPMVNENKNSKVKASSTKKSHTNQSNEKKTIRISLPLTTLQRLDCLRLTPSYQATSRSQLLSLLLEKVLEEQSIQEALNSLSKSIK